MSDETKATVWKNNVITRLEENLSIGKVFTDFSKAVVIGRIESKFEYSHTVYAEKFYRTRVRVKRPSGTEDLVPIVVSGFLLKQEMIKAECEGTWVEVVGQFRSYNKLGEDGRSHLDLFLFVTMIDICEDELQEDTYENIIYLDGYLCKLPVFRNTPLGRQITELLIAVNRKYNKSDYIPCISWGRLAKWVSHVEVGSRVKLYGRIQSRKYLKRDLPDSDEGEYKDAYEISVIRLEKVNT